MHRKKRKINIWNIVEKMRFAYKCTLTQHLLKHSMRDTLAKCTEIAHMHTVIDCHWRWLSNIICWLNKEGNHCSYYEIKICVSVISKVTFRSTHIIFKSYNGFSSEICCFMCSPVLLALKSDEQLQYFQMIKIKL